MTTVFDLFKGDPPQNEYKEVTYDCSVKKDDDDDDDANDMMGEDGSAGVVKDPAPETLPLKPK